MHVAQEHVAWTVACPHCAHQLDPWRLAAVGANQPTPAQPGGLPAFPSYSPRNRWLAGALGLTLGAFGVHRFYLGHTGIGLLQALLSLGSFFTLAPFIAVWGVIEGVLCFAGAMRDVDGLPLGG